MLNLLTDYTERAVAAAQHAARAAGLSQVPPEYLLAEILRYGDGNAALLLARLGLSPSDLEPVLPKQPSTSPRPSKSLPELGPAANRALLDASIRAGRVNDRRVGTEHLLLGLAMDLRSPVGEVLHAAGADPDTLCTVLAELRRDQDRGDAPWPLGDRLPDRRPSGVIAAVCILSMQITGCVICVPFAANEMVFSNPGAVACLGIAGWLWSGLCSAVLIRPILRGRQWGWAGAVGMLFAKSTAVLGLAAYYITYFWKNPASAAFPVLFLSLVFLLYPGILLLTTQALFRARSWYGVRPREGWRTTLRQGGWALAITALLDLPFAFLQVLHRG